MTDNKYWLYLERLRKSGIVNMHGAIPYLMQTFNISQKEAIKILSDWMQNYNKKDYK